MCAIFQRQRLRPDHIGYFQIPVEMREQLIAPRHFPFQGVAQTVRVNGKQHQIVCASEMFRSGFRSLRRG